LSELLLLFPLTLVALRLFATKATKLGFVDIPNERSIHDRYIPRGAGMVFVAISLLSLLLFHHELFKEHPYTLISIVIVTLGGAIDDRSGLDPIAKFAAIAIATVIIYFDGFRIVDVGRYMGVEVSLSWLSLPFTYFAVAGFTNAMNLIDGLDGLCASIAISIFSLFALVGYIYDDTFILLISLTFLTVLLAFLVYNWYPASLFMGDSGSLSLGFVISIVSIKALEYLPAPTILYIGALPILDTFFVIVRRKSNGIGAMTPDRCHLHHIMYRVTGSETLTVGILLGIQTLFFIPAYFLHNLDNQIYALLLFFILFYLIYRVGILMIESFEIECFSEKRKI
jgi:UDP-GlcNAc:undecaprenyl-phosphate GlcNAc-1-phosphate transferase